jgi:hypothetical protein
MTKISSPEVTSLTFLVLLFSMPEASQQNAGI